MFGEDAPRPQQPGTVSLAAEAQDSSGSWPEVEVAAGAGLETAPRLAPSRSSGTSRPLKLSEAKEELSLLYLWRELTSV